MHKIFRIGFCSLLIIVLIIPSYMGPFHLGSSSAQVLNQLKWFAKMSINLNLQQQGIEISSTGNGPFSFTIRGDESITGSGEITQNVNLSGPYKGFLCNGMGTYVWDYNVGGNVDTNNNVANIVLTFTKSTVNGNVACQAQGQTVNLLMNNTPLQALGTPSIKINLNQGASASVPFAWGDISIELTGTNSVTPNTVSSKQQAVVESSAPSNTTQSANIKIPSWIKSNAKLWAEGSMGDEDFLKGIQFLLQQGIIQIESAPTSSNKLQQIPSWVKNTAKLWEEGQVGDDDFIHSIQYLLQNGIISIGQQSSYEMITYSDKEGNTLTVTAKPNEVLLFVSSGTNPDAVNKMIQNNGGSILDKIEKYGYYIIKVEDVPKFISASNQYDFVEDSFPNELLSEYMQVQESPTGGGYVDLNQTNWSDVPIASNAKVLVAQLDDFVFTREGYDKPHGVYVYSETSLLDGSIGGDIEKLNLQVAKNGVIWNGMMLTNLENAVDIAEKNHLKLVINLSLGSSFTDVNGNVYSHADLIAASDYKQIMDALAKNPYFNDNVIISKSAGNNPVDLGNVIDNLSNDPRYGQSFKSFILTSQTEDNSGETKLAEYEIQGTTKTETPAYGKGVIYDMLEDNCGAGSSCAAYKSTTAAALLWQWYPELKSSEITDLIKKNTSGDKYQLVDLKKAFISAWKIYKCICQGVNMGQYDNKINQIQPNTIAYQQNSPPHDATTLSTIPSNSISAEPLQIQVKTPIIITSEQNWDLVLATATGGLAPYHFQLDTMGGFPPVGMTLTPDGHLKGSTPSEGQNNFRICVVDTVGKSDCNQSSITVEPKLDISVSSVSCQVNSECSSHIISADGGQPGTVYRYFFSGPRNSMSGLGNLAIDTFGNLHGTPTVEGNYYVKVCASDQAQVSICQNTEIIVSSSSSSNSNVLSGPSDNISCSQEGGMEINGVCYACIPPNSPLAQYAPQKGWLICH